LLVCLLDNLNKRFIELHTVKKELQKFKKSQQHVHGPCRAYIIIVGVWQPVFFNLLLIVFAVQRQNVQILFLLDDLIEVLFSVELTQGLHDLVFR